MRSSAGQQTLPRYLEIGRILRERVQCGEIPVGEKLAGERQLARDFGVSPVTMSRALAELAREGIVVRVPGDGTYVRSEGDGRGSSDMTARHLYEILVDTSPIGQPMANYYMGTVMSGLQEAVVQHGCFVRFLRPGAPGARLRLEPKPRQGLLVLAPLAERGGEVAEMARRIPLVVCGARWPGVQVPTVDSDNVEAASQVVEYLLRLGHRDIALVCSPPIRTNSVDRLDGYRRALLCNGVQPREELIVHSAFQYEMGSGAAAQLDALMRSTGAPTALFATDYSLALESMARLRALGLHIPNDVSVVGFDDSLSAPYLSPPLTTVQQPLQQMGRRAAEMLLDLIEGGGHACPVAVCSCTLVVRGSCRSTRHD
ncbi:MAG: GntR family transcriptional regulator [Chthonomonadales bacterium]|nr:GntR family transcriptional regulator [Chthonomonadales bacterium]